MTPFQKAARFQQVLLTIATVSAFALIALVIIGSEQPGADPLAFAPMRTATQQVALVLRTFQDEVEPDVNQR